MSMRILIEQWHLDFLIPKGLPESESSAIHRTLDSSRCRSRIERAIRSVLRRYRSLTRVRITLTR